MTTDVQSMTAAEAQALQARQLDACAAALALARKEKEKALRLLVNLVREGDSVVRIRVAECLMEIGDERALVGLVVLMEDSNPQVRMTALGALGVLRIPESRGRIQAVLKSDPDLDVRISAARTLGKMHDRSGLILVKNLLDSDSEALRRKAIMALRDIIGQTFPLSAAGVESAKLYLEMNKSKFFTGGSQ